MQPSFLQRYLQAFHHIDGWFSYDAALLFMKYNQLAFQAGTHGNVLEIGVHHGLSAIAIAALRGPGKQLTAIDLFEDQGKNVSASGHGDRIRFEKNMREFYPDTSFSRVIARPSGELKPADLGSEFTFIHIDGGHSPEETYHDLKLAHDVSVAGGLIALDDYFNPEHPGVCEGAVEFSLRHPSWLRPLVVGYNKVLFQKSREQSPDLNASFIQTFPDLKYMAVQMWKSPVILLGSPFRQHIDLYASTPERFIPFGSIGARARFTPSVSNISARAGQRIEIEVEIENTSSEVFPSGEGVFGLSYHLVDHDNPRAWLSTSLAPGERCKVRLNMFAPAPSGKYGVEIDLVWEGVMWFKELGNPTVTIPLSVS